MSSNERSRGRGRSSYDTEPSTSGGKRSRDESSSSNGNGSKRQAPEKRNGNSSRKREQFQIIHTKPHEGETCYREGNRVILETNYFKLRTQLNGGSEWTIYKYHVTFEPECLIRRLQWFLFKQHKERIGGFLFDGTQLFTTRQLHGDDNRIELKSETHDKQVYTIQVVFTKIVQMNEQESLQVLNLILRRNMSGLKMTVVGRNYYDAHASINLNEFRIQLWPGYETSIRNYEHGILLNCDVAHKVMRTDTVYDLMRECQRNNRGNFMDNFKQRVLGITVLTGYNDKTYRIDDVDFDLTASSTFEKNNTKITISQYYAQKYQIDIRDPAQPLLISNPKERSLRGGENKPVWLVPELCRITGLDERQRNDMNLKMALKPYSQMVPRTRRERLIEFNRRIQSSEENARIREEFGLVVETNLVQVDAHCIGAIKLQFKNRELDLGEPIRERSGKASWDRECGRQSHPLYEAVGLRRWYTIFPESMEREMRQLVNKLREFGQAMGFDITEPRWVRVNTDQQMVQEIDNLASTNPSLILFGTTTNNKRNSDLYSSIKKKCFSDHAVASQVVTRFILQQRNRFDNVATKLAIQMCTKLGGAPWMAKCPLRNAMTIGFDVAKDSNNRSIFYGSLVATMDLREGGNFFSVVSRLDGPSCANEIAMNVIKALNAYEEKQGQLPNYIFFYRGGVSDGDLPYVRDIELAQLNNAIAKRYNSMPPKLAYIVVSKKINTRFWLKNGNDCRNPEPGTVIDNKVTLRERYEFFLVSQKCGQGTISPTNYNIIYDTTALAPVQIQKWTYIHTHLYFNWTGTTRIPAVLQYANKLGFLVSNYMHRAPNTNLSDRLFFL